MFSWESMHSIAVGGLAPHITELSAGLARRGHEVHIFTRQATGQGLYDYIDHVHYHRCPFVHSEDFLTYVYRMCDSFVWHYGETEHFMGRPFDVVHGHDWLASRAVARIKNERHRPSVFTVHSTEYGRCGNTHWEDPLSRRIRDLEWEGAYVADRVIAVSKTLGREVHDQYRVPADKIFSIYNGVDVAKYDTPVDVHEVRRQHSVGSDEPMVLFAGRLAWQKGPDILLEAIPRVLNRHPRAKVLFAGDGDMRPRLQERARTLGVSNSTYFLGHRSGRDLVGLFKSADMVCVPSRNEPFGIVILEAWSASKPVVATRIGGPAEFVEDDVNGWCVEASADHVGDGVGDMLANADDARQMGINGRREAESRFSWDHAAVATERVYESIWNTHSGADTFCIARAMLDGNGTVARSSGRKFGKVEAVMRNDATNGNGGTAVLTAGGPTHDQIRERAYQLYLRRHGAAGDPMVDWYQAEQELIREQETRVNRRVEASEPPAKTAVSTKSMPTETVVTPKPSAKPASGGATRRKKS